MPEYAALDRLLRALNPLPGAAVDGQHQLSVTGTVNIIGGGSGGTSATDEATVTPGSTALTPMGGLVGTFGADTGMSMGQTRVGMPKMSGQRIMYSALATPSGGDAMDNTNAAVRVNVVAGGAGGGVANVTVRGTANTDFHVGFASGAAGADGNIAMPVIFGSGYYASINPIIGSVNITGSLNPVGIFGSVNVLGTTTLGAIPTIWYGGIGADTTNSAIRVNIVAGAAGGGVANVTVRGTGNTDIHVGYASGAAGADGNIAMPVIFGSGYYASINPIVGSVNITGSINPVGIFGSLGALVGSVNITGSINPVGVFGSVQVVGSVNITGSINPVGVFGSVQVVGSVNITGSLNPVGIFGSVGVFGSVNSLASLAGVTTNGSLALDVDPRGNLTATSWIISMAASSQTQIAGTPPANQRIYFTSFHMVSDGSAYVQWMSPSGVAISGSMQLLPGAGFGLAGQLPAGPVVIGSQQSGIYLRAVGTINIGGYAVGYVGT